MTGWLRWLMAAVFPWPARHERKAAIEAARKQKVRSQEKAGYAVTVTREIEQLAAENHFAAAIAAQIAARHRKFRHPADVRENGV